MILEWVEGWARNAFAYSDRISSLRDWAFCRLADLYKTKFTARSLEQRFRFLYFRLVILLLFLLLYQSKILTNIAETDLKVIEISNFAILFVRSNLIIILLHQFRLCALFSQ